MVGVEYLMHGSCDYCRYSARFEIYEPNVCVILCAHAYIYEVDLEGVCVGEGGAD